MLVQELIHTVKRGSSSNRDAADRGLTGDQGHQAEIGALSSAQADAELKQTLTLRTVSLTSTSRSYSHPRRDI